MTEEWYIETIKKEVALVHDKFYGSLEFKINFKNGIVSNVNVQLAKSVMKVEPRA